MCVLVVCVLFVCVWAVHTFLSTSQCTPSTSMCLLMKTMSGHNGAGSGKLFFKSGFIIFFFFTMHTECWIAFIGEIWSCLHFFLFKTCGQQYSVSQALFQKHNVGYSEVRISLLRLFFLYLYLCIPFGPRGVRGTNCHNLVFSAVPEFRRSSNCGAEHLCLWPSGKDEP